MSQIFSHSPLVCKTHLFTKVKVLSCVYILLQSCWWTCSSWPFSTLCMQTLIFLPQSKICKPTSTQSKSFSCSSSPRTLEQVKRKNFNQIPGVWSSPEPRLAALSMSECGAVSAISQSLQTRDTGPLSKQLSTLSSSNVGVDYNFLINKKRS